MIHLPFPRLCPCGVAHRAPDGPDLTAWRRQYRGVWSNAAKGTMLDAVAPVYSGLATLYPSTTGANELGGTIGTPTALSESGNDVTVTVANNLVAGQQVTLSGMTPSGYNGTYTVTSASGTAFHYTNPTSGLGAGSVFGSVVHYAGSPAYARFANTWAANSGGSKALAPTLPSWNAPAGERVRWVTYHTAVSGGTYQGCDPLGGFAVQPASAETATDISSDIINSKAHGLAAGNFVVFWGTLPTGVVIGTVYMVVSTNLTADAFSVTTEFGTTADTPINLTGTQPFGFFIQRCIPQATVTQDTINLLSGSIDLNVLSL